MALENVMAVQYTTRDGQNASKEQSSETPKQTAKAGKDKQCTKRDLSEVKRFYAKAKEAKDRYDKLYTEKDDHTSPKEVDAGKAEYDKIKAFFKSDEFKKMEKLFQKCNQEMPYPKAEIPYFLPEGSGLDKDVRAF